MNTNTTTDPDSITARSDAADEVRGTYQRIRKGQPASHNSSASDLIFAFDKSSPSKYQVARPGAVDPNKARGGISLMRSLARVDSEDEVQDARRRIRERQRLEAEKAQLEREEKLWDRRLQRLEANTAIFGKEVVRDLCKKLDTPLLDPDTQTSKRMPLRRDKSLDFTSPTSSTRDPPLDGPFPPWGGELRPLDEPRETAASTNSTRQPLFDRLAQSLVSEPRPVEEPLETAATTSSADDQQMTAAIHLAEAYTALHRAGMTAAANMCWGFATGTFGEETMRGYYEAAQKDGA